jgi:hypothetical protein
VAVVGLLSLWLRDLIPVELLSTWGERLVGVMLLGIGVWAMRAALKHNVHAHEHEHDGERHLHIHTHSHGHQPAQPSPHRHTHAAFGIGTLHGLAGSSHFLGVLPHQTASCFICSVSHDQGLQAASTCWARRPYLLSFGVGTIAAMATANLFSWGMGWLTTRFGQRGVNAYRGLMGTASVVAIGVGCFWIATSWT